MYEQYKDRVAFFVVYIQEAHASDVWQMPSNIRESVVFRLPRSFEAGSTALPSRMIGSRGSASSSCNSMVRSPPTPLAETCDSIVTIRIVS